MYLLDKGFIEASSLVTGDYIVDQLQTRNSIFKVLRKKNKSLFVKQLNSFDTNNTYVLQKDATCLWLIKNEPVYKKLSKYVPEYFGYDTEKQVLVTEYIPGSINIQDYVTGKDNLSDTLWEQLVTIMTSFHFNASKSVTSSRSAQFFPRQVPWILSIVDMPAANQTSLSTTDNPNPVIQVVKSNPGFVQLIQHIKDNWVRTSLIHGDIKWVNLLVHDLHDKPKLKLIDWEIADIGDPMWDIAGILTALVTHELLYKNPGVQTPSYMPIQTGLRDMEKAWPIFKQFWGGYIRKRKSGQMEASVALSKCIQYTGGRLIQSAVEHNMMFPQLQPNATRLLQASYTILENHRQIFDILQSTEKLVEA